MIPPDKLYLRIDADHPAHLIGLIQGYVGEDVRIKEPWRVFLHHNKSRDEIDLSNQSFTSAGYDELSNRLKEKYPKSMAGRNYSGPNFWPDMNRDQAYDIIESVFEDATDDSLQTRLGESDNEPSSPTPSTNESHRPKILYFSELQKMLSKFESQIAAGESVEPPPQEQFTRHFKSALETVRMQEEEYRQHQIEEVYEEMREERRTGYERLESDLQDQSLLRSEKAELASELRATADGQIEEIKRASKKRLVEDRKRVREEYNWIKKQFSRNSPTG